MKPALERKLKEFGWYFLKHGGKHDRWTNGQETEEIPRHREAAARLHSNSPNTYGVYEQGKAAPTLEKLDQLLHAVDPDHSLVLTFS